MRKKKDKRIWLEKTRRKKTRGFVFRRNFPAISLRSLLQRGVRPFVAEGENSFVNIKTVLYTREKDEDKRVRRFLRGFWRENRRWVFEGERMTGKPLSFLKNDRLSMFCVICNIIPHV